MAKSRSLHQAVRFALATAAAAAGVSTLHAQVAPAPAPVPVEEVVVTGSRLLTPNEASISPITTVTATDLQATGLSRVEDVLNNLPMVFAGENSTVSNGADGTATVDLRGLGPQRTLVLINGRRLGPGAGDGRNYSDINQIPAALIERVDILTGGASAVYGADAVSGVVNFLLNTHFQGVKVDGSYNFYEHSNSNSVASVVAAAGDPLPPSRVNTGFGKDVSLLIGSNFAEDRGNATFYGTYDVSAASLEAKYDYSACSLSPSKGKLVCGGSGTSRGGYFTSFNPSSTPYTVDHATGQFRPFVTSGPTNDYYNFGPLNYFHTPNERWTGGTFVHYDVNTHVNAYGEVMFTRNKSVAQIAPSGDFFRRSFIPCNDPLLTAQEQAVICSPANLAALGTTETVPGFAAPVQGIAMLIGRRNVEGGNRQATFSNQAFRTLIGTKGEINDVWSYDVSAQHSTVDSSNGNLNYLSNPNIVNSLNVVANPATGTPTCVSVLTKADTSCVPWNIWAPGGVTKAATDYLSIPLLIEAGVTEEIVSGSATGDLGKYGVKLHSADQGLQANIGVEWRSESADFRPDAAEQAGNAAGSGGKVKPVSGNFHVKETFAELRLPLAEHVAFADSLALEGGYRYSDYSLGFNTSTYKLGLEWAPVRDLRTRASFQRAVRAPNILELFLPQAVLLDGTHDYCAGAINPATGILATGYTAAQCAFSGVTAAQYGHIGANNANQYNGLIGGNPNLAPESSDTKSVGLVLQPRMVPGLSLSLDYFDIKVKETIGPIGADTILQNCVTSGNSAYCNQVHRGTAGTLWRTEDGYISDTNVNFGSLSTKGFDVKGSYRVNLSTLGSLGAAIEGTKLNNLNNQPLTNGPTFDCVGFFGSKCGASNPSWRSVTNLTWSTPWNALDIGVRWRYIGSVGSETTSSDPQLKGAVFLPTAHIPAYSYFDLQASFQILKQVRFQLGVNNITDKNPPLVTGGDCPAISIAPAGSSCNGNTWPGTYDALGRYIFGHMTMQF